MPNDLLVTTTDILGIEVAKEYSGASGIYVDNENNVISITGDVGKEYNGIEPIVVNNEENLISANSAPIGVQEPLYFVQDDDEAVIIGLSGEYVTPSDITGKLDTSSFESWQQGQYTNDLTAINEKINEVSSNFEGYATEQWVEDKGYLTEVSIPESASWNETSEVVESNSGTWNTVSDKLDVTAQVISSCETSSVNDKTLVTKLNGNEIAVSYAGSAHVADIALKDYQGNSFIPFYAKTSALEEKLDTTAFSTVSGDFLTAHQSLSDYYTKDETSGKEELAQAFANIPGGDPEVNAYIHNSSASIDGTTSVVQSNSSTWSDITAYQSNSASLNEVSTTVQTNSATWGQGGVTSDYVPLSATVVNIGSANSAFDDSDGRGTFVQGTSNTAYYHSFAQGYNNSARSNSLAQGQGNTAYQHSLALGHYNSAAEYSLALGMFNSADNASIAVGNKNFAKNRSQAFGTYTIADNNGMAIGTHNNITSGAFVIGNGNSTARSDCFIIDHTGNVSAAGKISANGVELGAGGGSIPVSNSGDFYKVGFDGVDLYGYKSTSSTPNFVYSAVTSNTGSNIYADNGPSFYNVGFTSLENWSAFDIISISSNGNQIYPPEAGAHGAFTALDVYFKATSLYDYNNQPLNEFSGYIGKITLDDLVITSYFDKPSYYNDIARCNDFHLWFSGNRAGNLNDSQYVISVGNKVQSGTNTLSGIIVPSTAGLASESYVQTNSAVLTAMIADKQDTLTFGYDEQDRISAINNSAIAGGTDLEFGYTDADTISSINNSALTDVGLNNIVQTNSGSWGGSALPISAGPGIKVNLVDNTLVFSNDETVLFEGDALHNNATATLSEPFTNFEKIKVYGHTDDGTNYPWYTELPTFSGIGFIGVATNNAGWSKWFGLSVPDTTHIVPYTGYVATWASTTTGYLSNNWGITRVIGINRK